MASASAPTAGPGPRLAGIDLIRGIAIGAMIVYHLSWDLSADGLIVADVVSEPGWRIFARLIAGTFLALVGFNLVLAARNGLRLGPYLRRLGLIVAAALLVSAATYWFMPDAFVFFGILHAIAVCSVLALPFLRAPLWLTAIAAIFCFVAPRLFTSAFFDAGWWPVLGISEHPPMTVDYVPILPWFGVVLGGVVAGRLFLAHGKGSAFARFKASDAASRFIAAAGRWSLPIYLIHQPILVGILFLAAPLLGPSEQALARQFFGECEPSCAAVGYDTPTCASYCGCILTGLEQDGLLIIASRNALTEADRDKWLGHVTECRPKNPPPTTDNHL